MYSVKPITSIGFFLPKMLVTTNLQSRVFVGVSDEMIQKKKYLTGFVCHIGFLVK